MKRPVAILILFLLLPLSGFTAFRLIAPEDFARLISKGFLAFFLPGWALFLAVLAAAMTVALRRNRAVLSRLLALVEGMDFAAMSFYGRDFAAGNINDRRTILTVAVTRKSVIFPSLPGGRAMVLCAMKARGTAGLRFHLAAAPNSGPRLRTLAGWVEAAPGMYLLLRGGQTREEALALFTALSGETRAALEGAARSMASVGVTAGWDAVMLGRENALALAGGDPEVMECLEVRAAVPLEEDRAAFMRSLEALSALAEMMERDLAGFPRGR